MKHVDLLVTGGLGLIVIGLAMQVSQIDSAARASEYYSTRTIPIAFVASTLALFAVLLLRDWRRHARAPAEASNGMISILQPRRLIFLGASVLFVLAFEPLGFVLSSLVYLGVTAVLLGGGSRRELLISLGVAGVTIGFVYLVVVFGLESSLPELGLSL